MPPLNHSNYSFMKWRHSKKTIKTKWIMSLSLQIQPSWIHVANYITCSYFSSSIHSVFISCCSCYIPFALCLLWMYCSCLILLVILSPKLNCICKQQSSNKGIHINSQCHSFKSSGLSHLGIVCKGHLQRIQNYSHLISALMSDVPL